MCIWKGWRKNGCCTSVMCQEKKWKDDIKKNWWKKRRGSKKKGKFKNKECECGERSSSIG